MLILIAELIIFLGAHSFTAYRKSRLAAFPWFASPAYKGLHALVSLAGFALIIWGFSRYRAKDWCRFGTPVLDRRHQHGADVVRLRLARLHEPRARQNPRLAAPPHAVAVEIWALAPLARQGDAGGMLLFGSFLAWAVFDRIAVKRRGDPGAPRVADFTSADAIAPGGWNRRLRGDDLPASFGDRGAGDRGVQPGRCPGPRQGACPLNSPPRAEPLEPISGNSAP